VRFVAGVARERVEQRPARLRIGGARAAERLERQRVHRDAGAGERRDRARDRVARVS